MASRPVIEVKHGIVEREWAVVDALAPVYNSFVQGPLDRVRCACGWTARADEVDLYTAVPEHLGAQEVTGR